MFKLKYLVAALALSALTVSCDKDDDGIEPIRDYAEQYAKDISYVEKFLKTNKIQVVNSATSFTDQDVTFISVDEGDPAALWNHPNLTYRMARLGGLEYKVYYLKLRDGGGTDSSNEAPRPCNVDAVYASYHGYYLYANVTETATIVNLNSFEHSPMPTQMLSLESLVRGWGEIMPQFKGGTLNSQPGEPLSYDNFGAGIMFLPSALGYYNQTNSSIPAYVPLIFTFKLFDVQRLDQDYDGIPSYLEDIDGDGYIYHYTEADGYGPNPDDTDGDGIPNYRDVDDDGDNVLTKRELLTAPGASTYFDYFTVPDCSGNASDPNRLRRHLDPSCTGQ